MSLICARRRNYTRVTMETQNVNRPDQSEFSIISAYNYQIRIILFFKHI